MSYLIAVPEILDSAATDLASIAGTVRAANASAAAQTTGILAAAKDEVSATIAALFSDHAQAFQAVSAKAAAFHQQFTQALTAGAGAYADAEAASASHLGQLLAAIGAGTGVNGLLARPGATSAENVALIMGGSGEPIRTSSRPISTFTSRLFSRISRRKPYSHPKGITGSTPGSRV